MHKPSTLVHIHAAFLGGRARATGSINEKQHFSSGDTPRTYSRTRTKPGSHDTAGGIFAFSLTPPIPGFSSSSERLLLPEMQRSVPYGKGLIP